MFATLDVCIINIDKAETKFTNWESMALNNVYDNPNSFKLISISLRLSGRLSKFTTNVSSSPNLLGSGYCT